MKTLGEILKLAIAHVCNQRPRHEIEWLVAYAVGISRLDLYLQFDRPLDEKELSQIRAGIVRLKKGEPLSYIRGVAPFFHDEFVVSKDVLIPRPETEILVTEACQFLSQRKEPGFLFDVCTGSGCVGLSIKKLFPDWNVTLSDISPEALSIAKTNGTRLGLCVEYLLGDLLSPFDRKAHCIVANPPYLSLDEWVHADISVNQYEPKLALVGGVSGLEFYEKFFASLRDHAQLGACVLVEIGSTQASFVVALAANQSLSDITVIKDFSGKERVVKAFVT